MDRKSCPIWIMCMENNCRSPCYFSNWRRSVILSLVTKFGATSLYYYMINWQKLCSGQVKMLEIEANLHTNHLKNDGKVKMIHRWILFPIISKISSLVVCHEYFSNCDILHTIQHSSWKHPNILLSTCFSSRLLRESLSIHSMDIMLHFLLRFQQIVRFCLRIGICSLFIRFSNVLL